MRRAPGVRLHLEDRRRLLRLSSDPGTPSRVVRRARMVLRASDGATNEQIALELRTSPGTVALWRRRFLGHGVAGIARDAPRPGRPTVISDNQIESIVLTTFHRRPPTRAYWSARLLARDSGVSKSSVQRIWRSRGISPRLSPRLRARGTGFDFVGQVTDLVGVYLGPSERAIAFSTDGRLPARRTGLLSFGGSTPAERRRRREELLDFLRVTDRETPRSFEVHLLVDGRVAPLPVPVELWLRRHPRFHLHPVRRDVTGRSLIDALVDGFAERRSGAGRLSSPHRLNHALRAHLGPRRRNSAPFVWTATSDEIRGPGTRATIHR